MMFYLCFRLTLAAALSVIAASAQGSIGGLTTGLLFDPVTASIRPLQGPPGSSWLGSPLLRDVERAWVAPSAEMAIVQSRGSWLLARFAPESRATPLPHIQDVTAVAWTRTSVVLWRSSGAVTTLQADSLETGGFAVPEWRDVNVTALASTPDGSALVASVNDAERGGYYLLESGQAPQLIVAARTTVPPVFSPDGADLYLLDPEAKRVLRVKAFRSGGVPEPLPIADGTLRAPVGIALTPGGDSLLVADSASAAMYVFTLQGDERASVSVDFEPVSVQPLPGSAHFLLGNKLTASFPFHVVVAGTAPAVYFIPAGN